MNVRVGVGIDSHRFVEGRPLVLGGVVIPHDRGLDGHSDADVVIHAIVDAVLGALALGDIGSFFPDTDPAWRGANSRVFLARAAELAEEKGYVVGNVDATITAEEPKLRAHVTRMRERLAESMGVDASAVSIKATTAERMGALGRGEGIACTAVVLLMSESG